MKVAFVYPHWNHDVPPTPLSDSIAILGYELGRRLAASSEIVIYSVRRGSQQNAEVHEGVEYRRVSAAPDRLLRPFRIFLRTLDLFKLRHRRRTLYSSSLYYRGYAWQVARDIRTQRCDLVHIFTFPQYIPVIRSFNPDVKIVLHMEDHSLTERDERTLRRQLDQADLIIGCSRFVTDNVRRRFPDIADRCHVLYNGVDVSQFVDERRSTHDAPGSDRRLLFVGRVSPEKGVHVLLDAFEQVLARCPQATLDIVGPPVIAPGQFVDPLGQDSVLAGVRKFYRSPGSYQRYLRERLAPESAKRVSFVGVVPHVDAPRYYRESDIFVLPSLWHEPFGIPVIEAMASGTPVVATRGGAFPELVEHEVTGLLVDRGDVDGLAAAIARLLTDDPLSRSMGRRGRQRAIEQFGWDRIVRQLSDHYRAAGRSAQPDKAADGR